MNDTPTAPASDRLSRATPDAVDIARPGIAAFVDRVNRDVGGLHSFMLLRHGKVAAEAWWLPYGPDYPHVLYSLSKSFASTAVGLAVSEGHLRVEDKVIGFFPDDLPADVGPNLAAMRVWDLLTMSTGHDKDATGPMRSDPDGDWVHGFFAQPVEHAPGSKFVYNSAATFMLSALVQKLTGETLLAYLTPRLFDPLGITGATWESSPRGINVGGWGLSLRTEDIAKFGQLYLQQGQWHGRQIVPADWVVQATSAQVSNGDPTTSSDWSQGYGYQFWCCRHNAYRGDGAFGQYCVVLPEQDAVLAITSGLGNMQTVLDAVWEHLLPAMQSDSSSLKDEGGDLAPVLNALAVPIPQGQPTLPLAARVSGKTYRFPNNSQKIESLSLTFDTNGCQLLLRDANGEQAVTCGNREWVRGTAHLDVTPSDKVAAQGIWTQDNTYTATLCYYETPYIVTMICQFDGEDADQMTLLVRRNVGFGPTEEAALSGKSD